MQVDDTTGGRGALFDFFRARVDTAARDQGAGLEEPTRLYLAGVLTDSAEPGRGPPETTFVELRHDALRAPAGRAHVHWQRLGEAALLVAGVFAESLGRRCVSRSYCTAMGESAYGVLAHTSPATQWRAAFRQLSAEFEACADVLAEVREEPGDDDAAVVRVYGAWRATGSERLAARLRRLGVVAGRGRGFA
ncbi:MAG: hypothetical protein RLZZ299_82 [Pseudomonadota bacterium]